ncbi:MAG: hypothetical protein AAF386_00640 [Pseudomonadota bacterium]
MATSLSFAPLVPWPVLWLMLGLAVVVCGFAIWRGLSGWPLRLLAALVIAGALSNPSLQQEDRQDLPNIVVAVVDESSSQDIQDRTDQTREALAALEQRLAGQRNTDLRVVAVQDADQDGGTLVMAALAQTLANVPADQLAGVVFITDGIIHDMALAPDVGAPVHTVLIGRATDWDRRLVVQNAPAFGILDEPLSLTIRVEDQGQAPETGPARVEISIDGAPPQPFNLAIGQDAQVTLQLPHGGINVLQLSTPMVDGELTDRNNAAVLRINGVRDRLRVLLVSGEPHAGTRTWRNLLKSDASVDLVHFTILKPPGKQDGVPINELSLIAFPTRELFLDKIDEFDLIVFDRYKRRGLLPSAYFANIARYVTNGGAVLIAAGPDYAGVDSIFRSGLGDVLPGFPTARVFEQPVRPTVSDIGARHPVTQGLDDEMAGEDWGRWLRQVDVQALRGDVLMTGLDTKPLLILDRVGEGRVALLASDHAWLWDRGFEGGGPQKELLRRLAHWMMKEPELEEEALTATESGDGIVFTRRTLQETAPDPLSVTRPTGDTVELAWTQVAPGRFDATLPTTELGLYRATVGSLETVTALGPAAPKEFQQTIATADRIAPLVTQSQGGVYMATDSIPRVRTVRPRRPAAGPNWMGFYDRSAFVVQSVTLRPVLPAWVYVLLAAGLMLAAWLREGRKV